ncbi:hypothetical protein BJ508DRAFT_314528 [Ascobolus immersus RN42]|uniref:Uncharacterized protein n=1 Tax=Ascobolus immersus RN42 TaxID=1160509 RepID=A0A3N4HGQ0_ASCIM|nr:hypothetical protein BJ508DRAFT_336696 [Ascobolus immersus RN42]RPA72697.1 hypothetical protein BJ508DRAFT_314528 [Ascobolus immersus RN42]
MPYYQFAGNGWMNQVESYQPRYSSSRPESIATSASRSTLSCPPSASNETYTTSTPVTSSLATSASTATRMGGKKRTIPSGKGAGNQMARDYDDRDEDYDDAYPLVDSHADRGYPERTVDRAETMAPPSSKRYKPSITPRGGGYSSGNNTGQTSYPADARKSNTTSGPPAGSNSRPTGSSKGTPVIDNRRTQGGGSRGSGSRKVETPTSAQESSRMRQVRSPTVSSPSPTPDAELERVEEMRRLSRSNQHAADLEVVAHTIIPPQPAPRKPRCNWNAVQHTKTDSKCCFFTTDVDLFESKYHPVKGSETRDCSIEIILLNDGCYGPMIITRDGYRAGKFLSNKDIAMCNAFDASTHSLHCAVRWTDEVDLLSAGKLFYGIVSWKARNCPTLPSLSGTVGTHHSIVGGAQQVADDGRIIKREPGSSTGSYPGHGHGRM